MFKRLHLVALLAAAFAFAAPAFADGTGKGPTYNAPPPLTPQPYTIYTNPAPVPHTTYHSTTCRSSCGHSTGLSHSGLPTNPRQTCCGHSYAAPAPVYHAPAPAPVIHQAAPVMSMRAGDVVSLDPTTVASFGGGVGTGVNDVFVGGGGFGSGFNGGSFGLRSSGFFAGRNAALQSSIGGFRGARRGGFKGGNRGGFRGGRGGGSRGGRGGGRRGGGR